MSTFSLDAILQKTVIVPKSTFLYGFGNRKSKTITGSTAGVQTNYQLKLIVYKGSGTDTSDTVYLNDHCKDDFSDIRFTKVDNTLLDYWIESYISGVSAIVWIEIDSIPANPYTIDIYIYYDNQDAVTASSGVNTFDFFDDFDDGDHDGWTVSSGTWDASSGYLRDMGIANSRITTPISTVTSFVFEFKFLLEGATDCQPGISTPDLGYVFHLNVPAAFWLDKKNTLSRANSDTMIITGYGVPVINTWYKSKLTRLSDGNMEIFLDDISKGTIIDNYATSFSQIVLLGNSANGRYERYDDIRIRKFVSPEPTFTDTGIEENSFSICSYILKSISNTFTIDAYLIRTKLYNIDTILQKNFTKAVSLSSYLFKSNILKEFLLDSRLILRKETTSTISATLQKTFTKTFGFTGRVYYKNYWLSPWKCRKLVDVIGNNSTTQTDFVTKITVHYGIGTDTDADVYCNSRVKSNFSDLRFTKQDGKTLIQHEIVSYIDYDSAIVNVKVGYVPAAGGETNFYMYYSNSSAASTSVLTPDTLGRPNNLIETISSIPVNTINGKSSTISLDSGKKYLIGIIGSWINGGWGVVDAMYDVSSGYYMSHMLSDPYNAVAAGKYTGRVVEQYLTAGDDGAGNPSTINSRRIDPNTGQIIAGTYNAANTYYFSYTGEGSIINIYYIDDTITDYYTDNSGSFSSIIYDTIVITLVWGAQECRNIGSSMMRTHRVGLKIFNG